MDNPAALDHLLGMLEISGYSVEDLTRHAAQNGAGGVTVAEFMPTALAAMSTSTRDRYESYLQILSDGLPQTCWCQCPSCSSYVSSVCGCDDECDCEPAGTAPILTVEDGHVSVTELTDPSCQIRLSGLGDVPLGAITPTHLLVIGAWVQRRAAKRWVAANQSRTADDRHLHLRDGRSARENFVAATRAFFRTAVDEGVLRANPAEKTPKPRRQQTEARALSEGRLKQLWDAIWTTGSNDPELDMLVVWWHLEAASRRNGALSLTIDRLDVERCVATLVEKFGKVEQHPISPGLAQALWDHAHNRGAPDGGPLPPGAPVFYYTPRHDKTGGWVIRPMTSRRYDSLFARLRRYLPWADQVFLRPHDLRKTASVFVERAAGHAVARQFLHHQDSQTTDTYVRAQMQEVASALSLITGTPHPLAKEDQ